MFVSISKTYSWRSVALTCLGMLCTLSSFLVGRYTGESCGVGKADVRPKAEVTRSLSLARARLAGTRPGMPRDLAICLEARAQTDQELKSIILEKGDIGLAMARYQDEQRALKTFCAYALEIASPRPKPGPQERPT